MNLGYTVFIDGAARGNPGPAGLGVVVYAQGKEEAVREDASYLGETTNNVAEYKALIRALEILVELGAQQALIYSDSQLLIRQMIGEYKVKSERLKPLYEEAINLSSRIQNLSFKHIPRAKNKEADTLANKGIDGS